MRGLPACQQGLHPGQDQRCPASHSLERQLPGSPQGSERERKILQVWALSSQFMDLGKWKVCSGECSGLCVSGTQYLSGSNSF